MRACHARSLMSVRSGRSVGPRRGGLPPLSRRGRHRPRRGRPAAGRDADRRPQAPSGYADQADTSIDQVRRSASYASGVACHAPPVDRDLEIEDGVAQPPAVRIRQHDQHPDPGRSRLGSLSTSAVSRMSPASAPAGGEWHHLCTGHTPQRGVRWMSIPGCAVASPCVGSRHGRHHRPCRNARPDGSARVSQALRAWSTPAYRATLSRRGTDRHEIAAYRIVAWLQNRLRSGRAAGLASWHDGEERHDEAASWRPGSSQDRQGRAAPRPRHARPHRAGRRHPARRPLRRHACRLRTQLRNRAPARERGRVLARLADLPRRAAPWELLRPDPFPLSGGPRRGRRQGHEPRDERRDGRARGLRGGPRQGR